jgi:cerevisin
MDNAIRASVCPFYHKLQYFHCDMQIKTGIHYTVAAGNDDEMALNHSPSEIYEASEYPLQFSNQTFIHCFTVVAGAITIDKEVASFSNYGPSVDVWYLGVSVLGAFIGSNTATAVLSGTSMSSPAVAGLVAAAISAHGNTDPASMQKALLAAAIHDVTGVPYPDITKTGDARAVSF